MGIEGMSIDDKKVISIDEICKENGPLKLRLNVKHP
jgi:hypothetical protein